MGVKVLNTILLKSQIVLNNKRIPDVAKELRISKSAFYRKLRGDTEFTRQEISKMIDYLNLSVDIAMDIFFNEKVS
ncbi:helix-turn-helix domain-containing protein [Clostridium botulinum]|uniref:transcriptional regulator n=1 Tax=Clostridium botulinum TaxID=1491 RepID=UPI000717662B|nr:transcriptional regulator [Clostridium botulinum]MCW6070323.1 XRE family transcriptional regulator [Clostridium botulinum]